MGYLDILYSEERKPYTFYPIKLSSYLIHTFFKDSYKTLLDVGCGRGEYLRLFQIWGCRVRGIDQSEEARELCKGIKVDILNVDKQSLPYKDNSFNVVFCKSFIEHLSGPDNFMKEVHRVLKPGGRLIILTPDWESVYKTFYQDYTHKTPYTKESLRDLLLIHGFKVIKVGKFIQLPFLWKYPWLSFIPKILHYFPKSSIKLVRFSKEVMLIGVGER